MKTVGTPWGKKRGTWTFQELEVGYKGVGWRWRVPEVTLADLDKDVKKQQ